MSVRFLTSIIFETAGLLVKPEPVAAIGILEYWPERRGSHVT